MKRQLGEYVIFIDSDDYLEENMLETMYNKAQKSDSDLVICDYYEIENNHKAIQKAIN